MPIGIIRIVRSFGHRQLYDDYNRTKEGAIAVEYIVLDMEWNQALNFSEMVKDPVFLTGEIIQIGAIKLNQTLEVVDSFNERIAPQYRASPQGCGDHQTFQSGFTKRERVPYGV